MKIPCGELGIDGDGLAPNLPGLVFLARGFERVAEVQQGLRETGLTLDRGPVTIHSRSMVAGRLQQQSQVVR